MSARICIENPNEIPVILDEIHDCWFDVEDILLDSKTSILSIKFKREAIDKRRTSSRGWVLKKVEIPFVHCLLKIYHVKHYSINDTEGVGTYDFNELRFDPKLKRMCITTGVPIDIEIMVENFEVCVEVTDRIAEIKTTTSIFG